MEQSRKSSFTDRLVRAAKLDIHLYEEVEADQQAMGQALAIVVLSNISAGIGSIHGEWLSTLLTAPSHLFEPGYPGASYSHFPEPRPSRISTRVRSGAPRL
jgi:hypothetical protein